MRRVFGSPTRTPWRWLAIGMALLLLLLLASAVFFVATFDANSHRARIAAMVKEPGHQAAIAGGLCHFTGLPRIDIDGDTAVVTSYLQIITPHPTAEPLEVPNHGVTKGFRIHRAGSNRWDLVRTPAGWKIKRRTLRPLDGTEPARVILHNALQSYLPRN